MSPQEQLIDYIQKSKSIGKNDETIKQELLTAGWQAADVETALKDSTSTTLLSTMAAPVGYAGFWHRVAAVIVDSLLLQIASAIFFIPVIMLMATGALPDSKILLGFLYLVSFIVFFMYYPYMESKKGATFGKRFIGIQVQNEQQSFLSMPRSIGRNVAKILSLITLGIGFLMIAFTSKKQGLHDMITGAVLVKTVRANKYRTILTIILGTIGPALLAIFILPLLMVWIVGTLFVGPVGSDLDEFTSSKSDVTAQYQYEPREQLDMLLATTSITKMLDNRSDAFVEGYVAAGPSLVAWNTEYYGALSIYLPDFDGLYEADVVEVQIKEVLDENGVDVLDRTASDIPSEVWSVNYMVDDSYVYINEIQKGFPVKEGIAGESIKTVIGSVVFSVPLEGGETYERSYDFTLQHVQPM